MGKHYPCVYCTEDGYCKKHSDEELALRCIQSPCKDEEIQSNGDRIRAMTDEELAVWIVHKTEGNGFDGYEEHVKSWLDWLKQEATDAKVR